MRTNRGRSLAALIVLVCAAVQAQEQERRQEADDQDERLGRRLVTKSGTDADEDVMDAMVHTMEEAAHRLEIEFDAGDRTQQLQGQIVEQLNHAIRLAASQRRLRGSEAGVPSGDKRRLSRTTGTESKAPRADRQGLDPPKEHEKAWAPEERDEPRVTGELHELRRSWGQLPMRDREEIIQGWTEGFVERYRSWIERYYRALQESDEP